MQGGHLRHHHHHAHHLQQQLAALLSAALPQSTPTSTAADASVPFPPASEGSSSSAGERCDDSARAAALDSLRRAILYPPNSLLLSNSAPFLSQGLSQLLSDKSYGVRRAAALAYGSLCAVVSSAPLASNGLPAHVLTNGLVDRFVAWALPLLGSMGITTGSAELAVEGLREFLDAGDAAGLERYAPPILKACQELLEDERTSPALLHHLLGLLALISLRFGHCFQPHFIDIIDLLLGWALMPGLSESDRCVITDSFLQFRTHWLSNLHFSLRLLSKFLGDMEALIQDGSLEAKQQCRRLLPLLSCFSAVLQATASAMLEMNLLQQISEPIEGMAPRLLRCISMSGSKFGWLKWTGVAWRCLLLLAEILHEKFSNSYPIAIEILFQSLRGVPPSFQLHAVLKSNLQLLSLQQAGLLPSSVWTLLRFHSPLSLLRLHPDHLVVASSAATYLFILQHGCDAIVSQGIASLVEELELLRCMLGKSHEHAMDFEGLHVDSGADVLVGVDLDSAKEYSELELLSLMRFDLKVLTNSLSVNAVGSSPDQIINNTTRYERAMRLTSFILEKLNPFDLPTESSHELQVHVVRMMNKLSEVEFLAKLADSETSWKKVPGDLEGEIQGSDGIKNQLEVRISEYFRKYTLFIIRALHISSPITVKLEALNWIRTFCLSVLSMNKDVNLIRHSFESLRAASIGCDLLSSILDGAYDGELKVRSHVASVLELLLQAGLVHPGSFYSVSEVALDKLGDPDMLIKDAFVRVLSIALPFTVYACGLVEDGGVFSRLRPMRLDTKYYLNWKQTLALKQFPRRLNSQQLVSILSYLSQRWKVPVSSWIQRLVFSAAKKDASFSQQEDGDVEASGLWKDCNVEVSMLDKICPVNILAAVWWSIHEAARHCITLRLRTNLGGPTQTFAALERMLLDIPNVLLVDTEQGEGKFNTVSSNVHLLPMRLLLDFVEALKKNVYNAYEGSSVLPCPTPQSSLFFRANKRVCEEWFSRICEPMMNAGQALHCHDATFHYCALRLHDLRNLTASTFKDKARGAPAGENLRNLRSRLEGDVLTVLRHAALALCRCREPEALSGLQKWVLMAFPSLFVEEGQISPSLTGKYGLLSWMNGLIYQAKGQYEKAAAYFSHLLQSEAALSSMGSEGIQFIIERVIESYTSLSDWKSLETWLAELQTLRSLHAGKVYSGALTAAGNEINAVHALARFDEGDMQAAWGYLDLTPKSSTELTLDPRVALERSEQMLLRLMLQRAGGSDRMEDLEKTKLMLDEALSVVPLDGVSETASHAVQLHCIFAFEEGCKFSSQQEIKQLPSILGSLHQVLNSPISRVNQDCSLWIKVFRVYRAVVPTSLVTVLLCQKLHSLACRQGNFLLADRMYQYLKDHPLTSSEGKHTELLALSVKYERILLEYAEGKHEHALLNLWSLIRADILSTTIFAVENDNVVKAKACLKLADWFRRENMNINMRNVLSKMCEDFKECNNGSSLPTAGILLTDGDPIADANLNLTLEEIVGTSIKLSCHICPTLGKTWLSYASWCFNQARSFVPARGAVLQSCSLSPALHPEISADRFQLTKEEMSRLEAIIAKLYCHNSDILIANHHDEAADSILHPKNEALVNTFAQQAAYLMQVAAGAPGAEISDAECPSAALSSQLQTLFYRLKSGLKKGDILSSVNELIDIWWSLRKRRVSLFGHAAHGYFKYLSYSYSKLQEVHHGSAHVDVVKEKAWSCTLRAMLYILHILLNYGVELKETLEHGLATVPLLPWQEITPQLFARLSSHSKQVVRKQLEGLLMMLAKLSPWSVVFPTLVDINAYEGEPSEELQRIFDCLAKLYPNLIHDVRLVINELGTLTVLWEEQWLSTLQDLHTDVIRRINMLKEEAARIAENSTLSLSEKNKINAARYSAVMAPIIVALERRLASTSRKPETAHELWFREEYGENLKAAILAFKTPPGSAAALGEVWRPFEAIATSLANYQRKSSIALGEVASKLALLSSSDVPMPGLEKQVSMFDSSGSSATDIQGIVTISSFCEKVMILSTKTKPKKLVLLGSDGQKYTYLLKGREDLRLDARIMQLLQAVNSVLNSCTDTRSMNLAIRYYSVTPISGRAGLIQWVDNVTSIYSIFKSWQTCTQLAQFSAIGVGSVKNPVPPVPRPYDMFYGKIIPALKEKGIRRVISRRDWPHEVKRKVLLELMKETPRQLLWQEMWCASEGFRAFNLKARRFSGSVAAMSMVGHILGLGDRHLDNILMDFSSGDVVHIDYNVCFDKGKRLKIPEIVPFRLTQTIEAALGLTGIEGTFRSNCEAVISILRKNKDLILMLLEVFVWDPLVEWTRGDSNDEAAIGGEEKKGMELAVSLSLFASRVQEMRAPLQEHHDLLLATLPSAESALKRFLDVLNQYELVSAIFYHAEKEKSSLLQHEASAKSIVAEATSIAEKAQASFEIQAIEFAQAKAVASEKAQEAAMWIEQHARIIDALRSGSIPDSHACMKLGSLEEAFSLTSAVLVSGVPLTIVPEPTQAQCYDLDREVSHVIADLDSGLSSAIEVLHEYAIALRRVLPLNYITTSPVNSWVQILQLSVNNLSSEVLSLARRQAADLIAKAQGDGLDSVKQRHRDLLHKMERYTMEIEKVDNECSELMNSLGSDTETKSKERLLSSFTKYMQFAGYSRNEDDFSGAHSGQKKCDGIKDSKAQGELEDKKAKVLATVCSSANELFKEVKSRVCDFSNNSTGRISWRLRDDSLQPGCGITFCEFEGQVEKCVLVAGFINELEELLGINLQGVTSTSASTSDKVKLTSDENWATVFQASLLSTKHLIEQMTIFVLPEIIRTVISYNLEVMEAFGSLSQIRGSIDTALEQLIEVELERASLVELEKNYFVKVGLITEQQLALEEAAAKGRDHLSWEEAEELASQEEACRAQLDQLHQTWNQKDTRSSSLTKIEANIKNSLVSSEHYFSSLINIEHETSLQTGKGKALLAALAKPFSELEAIDKKLALCCALPSCFHDSSSILADMVSSGSSVSESIWRFASLLKNLSFFIWKIGIMDSILDSCIHDISSSIDQNLDFDQLYNVLKKKLEIYLQEHIDKYMKERLAPALLLQIEKENENWQKWIEARKETGSNQVKSDVRAVRRVRYMLEEYCNAHETARAARSAVSLMKRQVTDLTEALGKTVLEIVQLEWLCDLSSKHPLKARLLSQNILGDEKFASVVLDLSRPKLLEKIQSFMSALVRSIECLQACERTSVPAEGQLERAMGWACAGPSTTGTGGSLVKSSGIPPDFHDHLLRRRQLLWAAREQASDIIKICTSLMEFEASRDGLFRLPSEKSSGHATGDGRSWQQAYLNALTSLDAAYHSFSCAEHEWKVAQSRMEAATNSLLSATNELCIASVKAKSASGNLQDTLRSLCDCAYEASAALSAFSSVSRGHTALTSECGSMLEEVLAITEDLHDVYSLGKEAATVHKALMEDLSKANMILLPLEASLSMDIAAMADAISNEKENGIDIPPVHGQALYQSYCFRLREAGQALEPLVSSLTFSVKELHSLLTKLARVSSVHAGNLHKALEGLGISQVVRSQELTLSESQLSDHAFQFDDKEKNIFLRGSGGSIEKLATSGELFLEDDGWISPPEHTYTSSPDSSITSTEASPSDISGRTEHILAGNVAEEDGLVCTSFTSTSGNSAFVEKSEPPYVESEDNVCSDSAVAPDPLEIIQALSLEATDITSLATALQPNPGQSMQGLSSSNGARVTNTDLPNMEKVTSEAMPSTRMYEQFSLKQLEGFDEFHCDPLCSSSASHIRGKNAYALSVLKQVDLKLEGRENENMRPMKIIEQVDHLLKQATSIDNLCNMYEGWTPWI